MVIVARLCTKHLHSCHCIMSLYLPNLTLALAMYLALSSSILEDMMPVEWLEIKSPVTAFYTDPQSAGSQTTMIETEIFVPW